MTLSKCLLAGKYCCLHLNNRSDPGKLIIIFFVLWIGLATHEVHFTIIREEFKPNQKKPCEICAQVGRVHWIICETK